MTAPTPGPWRYCGCGKCGLVYAPEAGVEIAEAVVFRSSGDTPAPDNATRIANARLIASAPSMADRLELVRPLIEAARSYKAAHHELATTHVGEESVFRTLWDRYFAAVRELERAARELEEGVPIENRTNE